MRDDEPSMSELVEQRLPYDGPHDDHTAVEAAQAVAVLMRYLNNATYQRTDVLGYAPQIYRLVGALRDGVYRLDELMDHLAEELKHKARHDHTMVDDRGEAYSPEGTAREAARYLENAQQGAVDATNLLEQAFSSLSHLGHDSSGGAQ